MAGAGNGIRTRDFQLGKLTLYQLSYARWSKNNNQRRVVCKGMVLGTGREVLSFKF